MPLSAAARRRCRAAAALCLAEPTRSDDFWQRMYKGARELVRSEEWEARLGGLRVAKVRAGRGGLGLHRSAPRSAGAFRSAAQTRQQQLPH